MSDTNVAEILKLPAEERLRLVELLWESLTSAPVDVMLSDAHRHALDAELADHQRNPDDVLTLEQVLSTVRHPE
jgi:putative addiction module component (TIGR02574 family)